MAGASRAKAARLMSRWLGVGLSLNRIGFGLTYLLHPARGGRAWIGRAAGDPATTVIMRGHGALGCGGLSALARGDARGRGLDRRPGSRRRGGLRLHARRARAIAAARSAPLPCWSLASLRSTGTSTPRSSTPPDHAAHQVRARRRGDRPLGFRVRVRPRGCRTRRLLRAGRPPDRVAGLAVAVGQLQRLESKM